MKRLTLFITLIGLLTLVYVPNAMANGVYFSKIPEGLTKDCTLCHSSVPSLNEFGEKFKANNFGFAGLLGDKKDDQQPEKPDAVGGTNQPQDKQDPGVVAGQPSAKQDAKIELILSGVMARGEKTQLQAKVTVDGKPLAGKQVDFIEETNFFGQTKMNIGKASTGADGIAEINYWPGSAAEKVNVIASIDGDSKINAGQAAGSFALTGTGPLYQRGEGLQIPFLGTWAIGLFVGGIWATYFFAGNKMLEIRKFAKTKEQEVVREEEERSEARA